MDGIFISPEYSFFIVYSSDEIIFFDNDQVKIEFIGQFDLGVTITDLSLFVKLISYSEYGEIENPDIKELCFTALLKVKWIESFLVINSFFGKFSR